MRYAWTNTKMGTCCGSSPVITGITIDVFYPGYWKNPRCVLCVNDLVFPRLRQRYLWLLVRWGEEEEWWMGLLCWEEEEEGEEEVRGGGGR